MYIPPHFSVTEPQALHRLMAEHPFGTLVTHGPDGLDANHVPFEFEPQAGGHGILKAHVARANPLWREVRDGDDVLVVFGGGDAYISPSWYPSKQESHQVVPTWNYKVVHAHGRITVHDDERYVRGVVARLTRTHEASLPAPWKMTDAPPDYIDMMLKSIVGIEVEVTRLVGKFKLSQNREERDLRGAAQALMQRGETQARLGQDMLGTAPQRDAGQG
jgi:transcriptional regulator